MANIMEMFKAQYRPSRDGYDLSKNNAFTAKAGEILPVYSKLVMKGDKFKGSVRSFTNTRPLNSDAYTSIREYYNWYFVPMNLLWDKFNVWSVDLKDNAQVASSINGNQPLSDKHPYFTTGQIYDALSEMDGLSEAQNKLNTFGFERGKLARKLLHYLGYGDFYRSRTSLIKNVELSPWRLLAYQKIYQDFYRDSQWESSRPGLFNLNYMSGAEGTNQIPLDEVDYTKWSMFDIRYSNWNKDYFMGLLPNSQFGDAAEVALNDASSNVDILPYVIKTQSQIGTMHGNPTPVPFDMFTQHDGISAITGDLMSLGSGETGQGTLAIKSSDGAHTPVHVKLDQNSLIKLRSSLGLLQANYLKSAELEKNPAYSDVSSIKSAFTILALRQAEALQKYKEIKQSNKQDFPSQSQALFGVRPSNAYSNRSQWITGQSSTIDINPVVNTNLADGNAANVRGRGLGALQGDFSFESDVDGVLMCIYHAVPVLDYAITGVHPDNTKTYLTDYAQPVFDKTGMQSVPLVHLMNHWPDTALGFAGGENLLGYGPIYLDYKTDIDEIHGAFYNGGLENWVAPVSQDYIKEWLEGNQSGDYSVWNGLNANFFKVNPETLNPIFTTPVDSDVESDQFWCRAFFNIHAVRNLDRQGLPY